MLAAFMFVTTVMRIYFIQLQNRLPSVWLAMMFVCVALSCTPEGYHQGHEWGSCCARQQLRDGERQDLWERQDLSEHQDLPFHSLAPNYNSV